MSDQWAVYKQRWFVLFVALFCNVCAGLLWMPYSTVTDLAAKYYQVPQTMISLLPASIFVSSALLGIPAMWVLDRKNLKTGLTTGSLLIFVGYLFRAVPVLVELSPSTRFYLGWAGHFLVGFGIPFVSFTPSKVSEHWFPERQRLLSITLISMGNLIGLMLSDLLVEKILALGYDIGYMTVFLGMPSGLAFVLCFCVVHSRPRTPPSGVAAIISIRPFFPGIQQLLKQTPFLVLLAYTGAAIGSIFSMLTITRELVMANSIYFCGLFGAVLIGSGMAGTLLATLLARRMQNIVLVEKLAVACHCICLSLLYLALNYRVELPGMLTANQLLLLLSALNGFFGFMVIPLGLDLASDCSFPNCTEAASNGLLLISGYLQSLLYIGVMRVFSRQVVHCKGFGGDQLTSSMRDSPWLLLNRQNTLGPLAKRLCDTYTDYSVSLMIQTVIMVLVGCFFIIIFETEYRRMNTNRRMQVDKILRYDEHMPANALYS